MTLFWGLVKLKAMCTAIKIRSSWVPTLYVFFISEQNHAQNDLCDSGVYWKQENGHICSHNNLNLLENSCWKVFELGCWVFLFLTSFHCCSLLFVSATLKMSTWKLYFLGRASCVWDSVLYGLLRRSTTLSKMPFVTSVLIAWRRWISVLAWQTP